jgi:HEAT repeat protein
VRHRNLEILANRFADSEAAKLAAESALDDGDQWVRVLAATMVRNEKALEILRAVVADPHSSTELRVMALNRLVSKFGYDEAKELVTRAFASRQEEIRRAAIEAASDAGDLSQLEQICALAADVVPAIASLVATALGKLGDARAETTLIGLLGHEVIEVRAAAASALGLVGTVRAVVPLLPLTEGILHGELRQAARDAIRKIQSRLGDAEAGRISLAGAEESSGAVSLTTEGGEVSIAQDPAAKRTKS